MLGVIEDGNDKIVFSKGELDDLINKAWEEHNEYVRAKLSEEETNSIYRRRKIDVEPVFGFLKANLTFKRFSIRGISKVKKEIGFALMAVNLRKYTANIMPNHDLYKNMKKVEIKPYLISTFLFLTSYVPASFYFSLVMSQLSVL